MKVTPYSEKDIPAISREVINSLDLLHRAIAEVMSERGEVRIFDGGAEK